MKKSIIILSAISVMSLSSCSLYESVMGKKSSTTVSGAQATEITDVHNGENRSDLADRIADNPQRNQKRDMPPVRIQPMPVIIADTTEAVTPVEPEVIEMSPTARILGGSWTIVQVGNTIIDRDEDMPYIVFSPQTNSFYANNGCNTLNGTYDVKNDKISFHNVLSTLRYCGDVQFDHEINTIICDETETEVRFEEIGSETILEFITPGGKQLMRLRRGNLEFLNGQWDVVSVGTLSELKAPATIFFDMTDMKLHGNTGCNFINGEIYADHRMANAVDFSQIITTLRACEFPQQQTAILVALEETASAISDGADEVILLDQEGRIMMKLRKSAQN